MSDDNNDSISTEIKRPDAFQHLQSTFTNSQRARPPAMEFPTESEDTRIPLKPSKLNRRESKGGLRAMFSRNKVGKTATLPFLDEPPTSAISSYPVEAVSEERSQSSPLTRVATQPPMPAVPATPKPASKASRLNLRSKSVKHNRTVPKPSPKSSITSPKPPTRPSAAWDPPPLFQAYPQAIKHATLAASSLSADSIIRISNHKRNNSLRDDVTQSRNNGDLPEQTAATKKAERAKSKHRRQVSGSISKADWTQKIFVLVTSGYLLQYAGEGSFDRLPEKMMQLGKDSVAFASDVIPGKHWVLQISQSMDADGTPTADSRSLLSRLSFRGADYRRTATSLLLVLTSAEDMDSWIAVVRREIEALGGKKHVSETGKPKVDDKITQLRAQPSHRYLVQKNPDQSSNPASPTSPSFTSPVWGKGEEMREKLDDAASVFTRPQSIFRPSTGRQSVANSVVSHDGRQLESLRDSTHRLSYMSSGQRTLITSQCSSTTSSPTRESHPSLDDVQREHSTEDAHPRPNAAAINERRRSMQLLNMPVLDAPPPPKNYRHSTFGSVPPRLHQNHPPPTPNFSTPIRFSSSRVLVPETASIPSVVTTTSTPNKARDMASTSTRKAPPVALHLARPLPPVEDTDMPSKRLPPVFTPTESSFKMVQQLKPSVIDIPPRSPNATPLPTSPVDLPKRMSSLVSLHSAETSHLYFQFPKRFSSMQTPSDAVNETQDELLMSSPLAPAPRPYSSHTPEHSKLITHSTPDANPDHEHLTPPSNLTSTKPKLRRPTSIQIRPQSSTPATRSTKPPVSYNFSSPNRPVSRSSTQVPSFQRMKVQMHPKAVGNSKSMPVLVNGPPLAPPPDCELPPLPGNVRMSRSMGGRNSLLKV